MSLWNDFKGAFGGIGGQSQAEAEAHIRKQQADINAILAKREREGSISSQAADKARGEVEKIADLDNEYIGYVEGFTEEIGDELKNPGAVVGRAAGYVGDVGGAAANVAGKAAGGFVANLGFGGFGLLAVVLLGVGVWAFTIGPLAGVKLKGLK